MADAAAGTQMDQNQRRDGKIRELVRELTGAVSEEGLNERVDSRNLHRYTSSMADGLRISHTSAMILQAIGAGHVYGYTVMEVTGLPSGTVYPALRRLESERLIRSQWERQAIAAAELRPARKYYRLTRSGEESLEAVRKRYPLIAKLAPAQEVADK